MPQNVTVTLQTDTLGKLTMTYHYQPIEESEYDKIRRGLAILQGVIDRENKRPMMDETIHTGMRMLLEEYNALLENELDCDPTPQYLWDDSGGEPPVTMGEMHTIALQQHREMHS